MGGARGGPRATRGRLGTAQGFARTADGFTLMEVIVVLTVVAALVALLTPMIIGYIDDAQKGRAANDAQQIAAAVLKMFSDTGKFPFKKDGAGSNSRDAVNDAELLFSSEGSDATDATGGSWNLATTNKDSIENQLITNTPFGDGTKKYPTTGKSAWKGPYLDKPKADPWGNKFYVNIGKADPAAASPKAVVVISAGPNGKLETNADQAATTAIAPVGDDIIARAK